MCNQTLDSKDKFDLPARSVLDFQKKKNTAYSFILVCSFMGFKKMPVSLFIPVWLYIRDFRVYDRLSNNKHGKYFFCLASCFSFSNMLFC